MEASFSDLFHASIVVVAMEPPQSETNEISDGFERLFQVKVGMIPCSAGYKGTEKYILYLNSNFLMITAWEGCLQYFDSVSGVLQSFNFDNGLGLQLSYQEYAICIRNHRGFCAITYTGFKNRVNFDI